MTAPDWWRRAICYQIYPRSFFDASGDGNGDLPGIIAKLDYLDWLGIDALWISPFYPSPNFDWGYDVSDYTGVDPDFGTLADFDRLIAESHRRGIRVLLDLVLNHTSDRHAWFQESKSGRNNPYRDWFIWQDGRDGGPPNDWESLFGGSAWEFDENTGQYYYHFFFPEQPDLNWRNPEVWKAMFDVMRFWYDRGVDGFRLDAITHIFEREDLADCGIADSLEDLFIQARQGLFDAGVSRIGEKIRYQQHLPETHDLMRAMRALTNEYPDRILLGEVKELSYYGNGRDELHSVFNFDMIRKDLDAAKLREILMGRRKDLPAGAWDCNTVGNHDRQRSYSLFSDGKDDAARARTGLALAMFLEGTPVFYNGEEIGMESFPPASLDQVRDGLAHWAYQAMRRRTEIPEEVASSIVLREVSRDGCRTPMQWDASANAGFSPPGVTTWLPVHSNYIAGVNVAAQMDRADSMLTFFREIAALRKAHPALQTGEMVFLPDTGDALVFERQASDRVLFVALNLSPGICRCSRALEATEILFTTAGERYHPSELQPYEIRIGRR